MSFSKVGKLWLLLALSALIPASCTSAGPSAWVAPSLVRIGPKDPPRSGARAEIRAGRGESESFQIVVSAPSGGLTNVNVAVSDLVAPAGHVIAEANLTLYREKYVYVSTGSPDWRGSNRPLGPGWYPDGLIPFVNPSTGAPLSGATLTAVPFDLDSGNNQPIWVDIFVPRSTPAGRYQGRFTVTSDQGGAGGQIVLEVWDFTLPLEPSLKSSFLFRQSANRAAKQELLRHKIMPSTTDPSDQRGLAEDFGLKNTNLGFWSGADINRCSMAPPPAVSQFRKAAKAQHLGLFLYNYTADEIGKCTNLYGTIKQWAFNMHQAGVKNLITMAPVPELYDDGSGSGRSAVDIWVLLPVMYDGSVTNVRRALEKGDEIWSYNTLVQDPYSPKWLIDFAPINFRIQPGFLSQSLNLTGLLYWRVDSWSPDPWSNVYTPGFPDYPGEGMLVYPGDAVGIDGVVPSMRLKWLRDGIEDYEYIELLKAAGRGSWALEVGREVGENWGNWTREPGVLEAARKRLGEEISRLSGSPLRRDELLPRKPRPVVPPPRRER